MFDAGYWILAVIDVRKGTPSGAFRNFPARIDTNWRRGKGRAND
jgi:hypothetical protein